MVTCVLKQKTPGQLVVQVTDRCNAACPQCGMRSTRKYPRTRLVQERLFRIIDAAAEKGVRSLSLTGGEPFLLGDDLIELIRRAVSVGIDYVRTGTNGFLFMGWENKGFERRIGLLAEKLAGSGLRNFWISLDSVDPGTHEAMRGLPGVVEGIRRALPLFHRNGLYPAANLGINRNLTQQTAALDFSGERVETRDIDRFRHVYAQGFRDFYATVIGMGFTMVNSCYPMSQEKDDNPDSVYIAGSPDRLVRFSSQEKKALYEALFEVIPEFRDKIRIFSPRSSLYALIQELSGKGASYPCRGGVDYFFVDAGKGRTYPCGYRGGEDLGFFEQLDLNSIKPDAWCRKCHWECFRDPSELAGPFVDVIWRPAELIRSWKKDKTRARLWFEDLKYYRACGWFDGRKQAVFN